MADINGTEGQDLILGTDTDDLILALAGDDILLGSLGNDTLNGGNNIDTVDYNTLPIGPITLLPTGAISKGTQGTDQLIRIERIVGAVDQANAIDASTATGSTFIDVNLGETRLTVNDIPGVGSLTRTVENFVNVTGTGNSDLITGNNVNNSLNGGLGDDSLIGGGGNDFLVGGDNNDTLNGTNATLRGNRELDTLQGGSQVDRFILGDSLGSYYRFAGERDFAQITDFRGDSIVLGANEVYNIERDSLGFDIFVVTGGIRDLVADVQTSLSIGVASTSASSRFLFASTLESAEATESVLPTGDFQLASGETLGIFTAA